MEIQLNFEEKMMRLEEIVEDMQSNKISLDKSIKLFEEGTGLIAALNKELSKAEEKVKILLMKNGEYSEADFTQGETD